MLAYLPTASGDPHRRPQARVAATDPLPRLLPFAIFRVRAHSGLTANRLITLRINVLRTRQKNMQLYNFVSFAGLFVLMGVAWLFSTNRRNMNWRLIFWGILLQFVFATFVFVVPVGARAFLFVNDMVVKVLDSATAGSKFVFGRLALAPGAVSETGESSLGFILAFQAMPTIIFFSALMSVLYYVRIMPWLIRGFSWIFTRLMRVSGAEAMVNASNIFVGVEAAFTIRPHLAGLTRSELNVVLTSGMATVASNVLALYVFSLQKVFPTIAGHLISASILAAPAALVMSKIVVPETEKPETMGREVRPHYEEDHSLFDAVISGANAGVKVIVGIVALLIAILGLVALADLLLGAAGGSLNGAFHWNVDWSLKGLLGYVFYPFTLVIGVPPVDAWTVAKIIGERTVWTEVTSYFDLATAMGNGVLKSPRSALIAVYALCGFAHVASMAIFVGGTAALAPGRTRDLSRLALRALVAATLSCLMTACVAGTFYTGSSILFGR
jgi:concentrative nucleoside transporter, CNT family